MQPTFLYHACISLAVTEIYMHICNTAVHRHMMKLYGVETYSLSKSKTQQEGAKMKHLFQKTVVLHGIPV